MTANATTGLTHGLTSPTDPTRAVVLGAGGFIGRELVATLGEARVPTLALRSGDLDLASAGAGDELASMLRPDDAVVVLSALTPDKGRGREPFMRNLVMGANVCSALEKVPPTHVVYFSSDAVYPLGAGLVSEDSCAQPTDLYGAMHLARELMITSCTRAPVAVLRATLVYGAGDTHNAYGPNRLRRAAHAEGRIALFGQGEEMRDHIDVRDVIRLAVLVLRHRSAGTLNLATGRSTSYEELARKVAALFDRPIEIAFGPRQVPVTHRHFDVAALRRAFPTFVATPLEEGLARAHREMLERA